MPNRSQKEDVLTSSKYLRSGLLRSAAFPIMLAAVGLLLASLVLGLGTNYAHALGDKEGGICGYSDLVRDAILANNEHKSYQCNSDTYVGVKSSWGGTTSTIAGTALTGEAVADKQDEAKDLDLSAASSPFKPGKGELDGFVRGSRVDLTGTDLTVADIDLSDAVKSNVDADGNAVAYTRLGWAIGRGDGTAATVANAIADPPVRNNNAPDAIGVTFLLDGGSKSSNGLTHTTFEGTEGEIVWITFGYGSPPKALTGINDNDGGVWLRVDFTVDGVATEKVSAMISTADDPTPFTRYRTGSRTTLKTISEEPTRDRSIYHSAAVGLSPKRSRAPTLTVATPTLTRTSTPKSLKTAFLAPLAMQT